MITIFLDLRKTLSFKVRKVLYLFLFHAREFHLICQKYLQLFVVHSIKSEQLFNFTPNSKVK